MSRRVFPYKSTQTIAVTGGTFSWDMTKVPAKMEGKYVHILGGMVQFAQNLVQAATTGVAMKGVDQFLQVTDCSWYRTSARLMHKESGHGTRMLAVVKNGGYEVCPLVGDLAANAGGSAVTTAQTWWLPILFEQANSIDALNAVWPGAAFRRTGNLSITVGNPQTVLDTTITLSGSFTADLYLFLELRDEPVVGMDIKRFYLDDASTSGSNVTIPAGDYTYLILAGERFGNGGGESHITKVSAIDGTAFLPTAIPNLNAQLYINEYLATHLQGATDNRVASGYAVPVIYPGRYGKFASNALRVDAPFQLALTCSPAFTNKPRWVLEQVLDRDATEIGQLAADLGIKNLSNVFMPADGRQVQEHRSKFVPMTLVDGHVPSELRGVRKRQPGAAA